MVTAKHFVLPFNQHHQQPQPGGGLLLGLLPLLTMHYVNAEGQQSLDKPKRLNDPTSISITPKRLIHCLSHALPAL